MVIFLGALIMGVCLVVDNSLDVEEIANVIDKGRDLVARGCKHYTINSGQQSTCDEAVKAFWDCYDSHKPIPDGGIQWRLIPTLRTYRSGGNVYYQLIARFSIA